MRKQAASSSIPMQAPVIESNAFLNESLATEFVRHDPCCPNGAAEESQDTAFDSKLALSESWTRRQSSLRVAR